MKNIFLIIMFTCHFGYGSGLIDIISNGKEGTYDLNSIVNFTPVKKRSIGAVYTLTNFEVFEINHIEIRHQRPAIIYYQQLDVMPPCLFEHAPSYPEAEKILEAVNIDQLRGLLGREQTLDRQCSTWAFFKISPPSIKIIYIRVYRPDENKIEGVSVFESTGDLAEMTSGSFLKTSK
jgi:hypothetical protein